MRESIDLTLRMHRRWPRIFGDAGVEDLTRAAGHLLRLMGAILLAHLYRRNLDDEALASRVRQCAAEPSLDRLADLVDAFVRQEPEEAAALLGSTSLESIGSARFASELRRVATPLRGRGDVGALSEEPAAREFLQFSLEQIGMELDRREGGPYLRGARGALLPLSPFVAMDESGLVRPLAGFDGEQVRYVGPQGDKSQADDPTTLKGMASFALKLGMYARAAEIHDTLAARFGRPEDDRDGDAARHALRGYRYYRAGDYHRAAGEIRQALTLRPDLITMYYQLCLAHTKMGEPARAARVLETLLDRIPDARKAHELLGDLHLERGEATRALARYERARRLSPLDPLLAKKTERARARTDQDEMPEGAEEIEGVPRRVAGFLVDMMAEASTGRYHPVVGRERETEELIEILCCRDKRNPLILGDSGVGKTALVEDLALRMTAGEVPERLRGCRLYLLNVASLLAGAKYRGQFEERMLALLQELEHDGCLLFLDNLQTLVGSGLTRGGSLDSASLLRPALLRGELQAIGATTFEEYRNGIERDPAFSRCFQPVPIEELDLETTGQILLAARDRFEVYHGVRFEAADLLTMVEVVRRCLRERRLPDAALEVMDLAAARVALAVARKERSDPLVREEDHLEIISRRSGVPLARLTEPERDSLVGIEEILARRVVGQEEAIRQVAPVVRSTRQGIKLKPVCPNGVFLFIGPSGVGKTETALTLAEFLFGNEDKLIRIDMSEYMERINTTRLIGSAPGYVGYNDPNQLTDRLRRDPYSVVLLDEIEKADAQTLNLFLQVFDAGRLTDAHGRTVSFSHATVVMTSNVGTALFSRPRAGYQGGHPVGEGHPVSRSALMREVKRRFPPEFLNRIDEIVFFKPLGHRAICRIARLQLAGLFRSLAARGKELEITEAALDRLAEEGYSFEFGARNLGRILRQRILDPLALTALSPEWEGTRRVVIDQDLEDLVLRLDPGEDRGTLLPLESSEMPVEADPPAES